MAGIPPGSQTIVLSPNPFSTGKIVTGTSLPFWVMVTIACETSAPGEEKDHLA